MAVNERVDYISGDIVHGQLAPSQASRTMYTPGKSSSNSDSENWPTDFRIPTGTPAFDGEVAGPVEIKRNRAVKLHRNIVADHEIDAPITGTPVTVVIDNDSVWGTAYDPEHTFTPTEQDEFNIAGHQRSKENFERIDSVDRIYGA